MKVAITSRGNSLHDRIDTHLGRCAYFVVYDTESFETEIHPNQVRGMREGAGVEVARFLHLHHVRKVISSEIGYKVKTSLDQYQIQLIIYDDDDKTVQDIINMLKTSKKQ